MHQFGFVDLHTSFLSFACPILPPAVINMLAEGLKLAIERMLSQETYPENPHIFELPISQWKDWLQLHSRDVNWRIKTKYTSGMSPVLHCIIGINYYDRS